MEFLDNKSQYDKCKDILKKQVQERIDFSRDVSDEEIMEIIDSLVLITGKEYGISLEERGRIGKEIFDSLRKYDLLQELIEDEDVTEIMINGVNDIFVEKNGEIFRWNKKFESKEKLEDVIQQIVSKCNRTVTTANPIVDARLLGARVNVVLNPISINGPTVTIRKFPKEVLTLEKLIEIGSISNEVAEFLTELVQAGYNIFISGGTGSGKTTFLNALSKVIPQSERIITIEDSAELQLQEIPNLVTLETRNATSEGVKEITIRDLIKTALRMRPDRIVVGEVRGSEAIDMLTAFNTGHDGSLSTGHANSAKDMLSRLETMVLMGTGMPLPAIRRQIASGIDLIVHLGRLRDHSRKVIEIVEITGMEEEEIALNVLYEFEELKEENGRIIGKLMPRNELLQRQKLLANGGH